MKRIPISAAKHIAKEYGYDQVIVYARKVREKPEPHGEHITTYGVTKQHCEAAGLISKRLQAVMHWNPKQEQRKK